MHACMHTCITYIHTYIHTHAKHAHTHTLSLSHTHTYTYVHFHTHTHTGDKLGLILVSSSNAVVFGAQVGARSDEVDVEVAAGHTDTYITL